MKIKTLLAVVTASLFFASLTACKEEQARSEPPAETTETAETTVETETTAVTEVADTSEVTEAESTDPLEKDFYDLSEEEFDELSDEELLERLENAEKDEDDEDFAQAYSGWTRIPEPWEDPGDCIPGHSWSYDAIDVAFTIYVGEENEKAWIEAKNWKFDMGEFLADFNITKRDFLKLCREYKYLKYMYNINELYPPNENDQGEDNNDQGGRNNGQNNNQNDQGNSKSTSAPKDTTATTKKPSNQNQQ
jgi:hypothetical protein